MIVWQDVAMAALLGIGLAAQAGAVFSPTTVYPLSSSLGKLSSSLGLGVLQVSLGLWATATISLLYAASFAALAILRRPKAGQVVSTGNAVGGRGAQ